MTFYNPLLEIPAFLQGSIVYCDGQAKFFYDPDLAYQYYRELLTAGRSPKLDTRPLIKGYSDLSEIAKKELSRLGFSSKKLFLYINGITEEIEAIEFVKVENQFCSLFNLYRIENTKFIFVKSLYHDNIKAKHKGLCFIHNDITIPVTAFKVCWIR
jgi:hypothetical protein